MEFVIGDVVKLKSGGPEMTVKQWPFRTDDGEEYAGVIECEWFNPEGHLKHAVFKVEQLEKL